MRTNLASLVEDFRAHANEIAVVEHRGVRRFATTYGELAELAGKFSAELARRKIAPGERVVLWGANSAAWIGAFFGCLLRGVLVAPLDAAGSPEFAARVADDVKARLIVGDGALLEALDAQHVQAERIEFAQIAALKARPDFSVDASVKEDAPFQIVFTSGTTSEPKGIVHTHKNVLASLRPIEAEIEKYHKYERFVHPLRFLHTLPLSHVFGQFMGLWIPGILAGEIHFSDRMEPMSQMQLIRRERISVLIAVPRVLELLRTTLLQQFPWLAGELAASAGAKIQKRWWRFRKVHSALGWKFWAVISGGAALPVEVERFWNGLGIALIQGYGMTETAALVTLNHPFHVGHGTIGKVLPGREVKLSESGELMVRGDMVSSATWRHGQMEKREGEWLATGDLAAQNESGELTFVGRQGDAIVTAAGVNVYPQDLETALTAQAGVRQCAVVACDLGAGPEPVAVVLFNGDDSAFQDAVRKANAHLAGYQQMRRALQWPDAAFPYTSTGKLLRRKIRDWACEQLQRELHGDRQSNNPTQAGDALLRLIAEATGEPVHGSDDSLRLTEDLHLDSLGRVQLGSLLEQRMGVLLTDEQMARAQTVGELREMIGAAEMEVAEPDAKVGEPTQQHGRQDQQKAEMAAMAESSALAPEGEEQQQTRLEQRTAVARTARYVYPRWPWMWPMRVVRDVFIEAIARPLIWFFLAPRVSGVEHARSDAPLLIIANHVTALDGALVVYALPRHLRWRLAIAMAGEMLDEYRHARGQGNVFLNALAPGAYWLLTVLYNVFPLPRLQGFRQSFAHAGDAMDHGFSVLVFPEGRRSADGELQPFRQGIGLLASEAYAAVLPVALIGLQQLRSHQVRWFRSGVLEVRIGEPISLPPETSPDQWTQRLEAAMRELMSSPNAR